MKKIKIRIFTVFLIFAYIMTVCGCDNNESLPLNTVVKAILDENGIKNSKITRLYESESIDELYEYNSQIIENEELQDYIKGVLASH